MDTPPPPSNPDEEIRLLLESTGSGKPIFENVADLFDRAKIDEAVKRVVEELQPRAAEIWKKLPPKLQQIIEDLAKSENLDLYKVTIEWMVQRMFFTEICKHFKLEQVDRFPGTRPESIMFLSQSSSLVSAGQRDQRTGMRDVAYTRIQSRRESWNGDVNFPAQMYDIQVGGRGMFSNDLNTSPVQCIAVLPLGSTPEQIQNIVRSTTGALESVTQMTRLTPEERERVRKAWGRGQK